MSFIYLYSLNIDVICIVWTQMSYAYSYYLDSDVVCLFVLFTHIEERKHGKEPNIMCHYVGDKSRFKIWVEIHM